MTISIIIPTLNEAQNIGSLVRYLKQNGDDSVVEIIVVDAQSSDNTEGVAKEAGAIVLQALKRSRAAQMNQGAQYAKGDILYFIHADCYPPKSFVKDIHDYISEGYPMGCYRYKFDSDALLLKINSFFNRFEPLWCRGGDETFYVNRRVFDEFGGYDENYIIMEEYDFIRKARARYKLKIMPKYALVSARKYEANSWLRVQIANLTVFRMFKKGETPEKMAKKYREMLNYR